MGGKRGDPSSDTGAHRVAAEACGIPARGGRPHRSRRTDYAAMECAGGLWAWTGQIPRRVRIFSITSGYIAADRSQRLHRIWQRQSF